MSERTLTDLIEDWQTGFFVVLACAVVGVAVGVAARVVAGPPGLVVGFPVGMVLGFIVYSYVRYGR